MQLSILHQIDSQLNYKTCNFLYAELSVGFSTDMRVTYTPWLTIESDEIITSGSWTTLLDDVPSFDTIWWLGVNISCRSLIVGLSVVLFDDIWLEFCIFSHVSFVGWTDDVEDTVPPICNCAIVLPPGIRTARNAWLSLDWREDNLTCFHFSSTLYKICTISINTSDHTLICWELNWT